MKNHLLWPSLVLLALVMFSFLIGRYPNPNLDQSFFSDEIWRNLILYIRIPRVLTAVIVGMGLALAGLVMQTVFKNPLADPGLLGVSQAAGFGAALGILFFGGSRVVIQLLAFIMGALALLLSLLIARKIKNEKVISLVLAGIAISAIFSAGLGLLKYIADPVNQLPNIVFWLLGSLSNIGWKEFLQIALICLPIILFFWYYRWRLNIHALDKEVAFSLGMKNNRELNFILLASVLMTSAIISVSGLIGWVGLIIPNLARVMTASNNAKTLPLTLLMGAGFALICDNFARSLLAGEIPLGILTAFMGSLLFIGLLLDRRRLL